MMSANVGNGGHLYLRLVLPEPKQDEIDLVVRESIGLGDTQSTFAAEIFFSISQEPARG